MDLQCFGGVAKYGCGDMGISAACADIYGAGLACQWLDITNIPAGRYTMVIRVNWDQDPDALGRQEQRFDNNVAAVCVNITRDTLNVPSFTVLPNCQPLIDCAGDTFGLAVYDCMGNCNGTRVRGDLDLDTLQTDTDINLYMTDITSQNSVSPCNDLNGDNSLTVTDDDGCQQTLTKDIVCGSNYVAYELYNVCEGNFVETPNKSKNQLTIWSENNGKFLYEEVSRDNQDVILKDLNRINVYIKLTPTTCLYKDNSSTDFFIIYYGSWIYKSTSVSDTQSNSSITFTGNKTLATINKEWLAKVPYVYIRFVNHPMWNVTHGSVRTKKDAVDLSTNAGMNVGTFEARHKDAYGAAVELCYEKNGRKYRSLGEHNAMTLNEFNAFWIVRFNFSHRSF